MATVERERKGGEERERARARVCVFNNPLPYTEKQNF